MTENEVIRSIHGENGFEFISDTNAHAITSGSFVALQIVSNAVISAYTAKTGAGITGNTFTGVTLTAGMVIYCRLTSITLTSGSLIAYKG